jgi:hypothetical protein
VPAPPPPLARTRLAVEIISPGSRWSEVEERVADLLTENDTLDSEDVVPGFTLAVAELLR